MTLRLTNAAMPPADLPPTGCDHSFSAEPLRVILLGSLEDIQDTIKSLHSRGFADPNDWSRPLPTEYPQRLMVILTRRISR